MDSVFISREEARRAAERCAELLRQDFGVTRVTIFGSVAGDSPWHRHSDVDIAVEGLQARAYSEALAACYELLPPDLSMDLVPWETAWPSLRARLEGEYDMPKDALPALKVEIESEWDQLERLVERIEAFLAHAPADPDEIQVQGVGKYIHDVYNGIERIFERVSVRLDGDLPVGSNWHTLLLQRASHPFAEKRPAVIDRDLEQKLSEYLRFRHLFRHTYGYDLEWVRVQTLAADLPGVVQTLNNQLEAFLNEIAGKQET